MYSTEVAMEYTVLRSCEVHPVEELVAVDLLKLQVLMYNSQIPIFKC